MWISKASPSFVILELAIHAWCPNVHRFKVSILDRAGLLSQASMPNFPGLTLRCFPHTLPVKLYDFGWFWDMVSFWKSGIRRIFFWRGEAGGDVSLKCTLMIYAFCMDWPVGHSKLWKKMNLVDSSLIFLGCCVCFRQGASCYEPKSRGQREWLVYTRWYKGAPRKRSLTFAPSTMEHDEVP